MPQTIGQPIRRKEDLRLVRGNGRYSDDLSLPGQAYAVIVRSPHAHARIRAIDTAAARVMPGVLAVLTGADVTADGLKAIPHMPIPMKPPADIQLANRDGSARLRAAGAAADRPGALRRPAGRHGGGRNDRHRQGCRRAGRRGLRAAAGDRRDARRGARPTRHSSTTHRQCLHRRRRRRRGGDRGGIRARHPRGAVRHLGQRVTGVPLDARAAIGVYDPATDNYTLHAGSGGVVRQKPSLPACSASIRRRVRVECGDVGGNFGTRNAFYPEFALVAWAAKRLGRPVKWTCERSEAFVSDYQGRDQAIEAELALDDTGQFLALRGSIICNIGAHSVIVRAAGEVLGAADRGLPRPGGPCPRPRRADQHGADQPVPQRRPARGDLRDRAADRRGGAAVRLRPHRSAPPQPRLRPRPSPTPTRSA